MEMCAKNNHVYFVSLEHINFAVEFHVYTLHHGSY